MIPDTNFTLAKAKAHLRITWADEDALITAFLDAAVGAVERLTRRAWTERTWATVVDACDLAACGCDSAVFHALLSPATVAAFKSDGAGGEVAIPAADAVHSTRYGHTVVRFAGWSAEADSGNAGRIEWTAKPTDDEVPPDVYAAVMLHLGDLYANREAAVVGISASPNPAADMLLRPYVLEMHA